jgi:hypothetical protein
VFWQISSLFLCLVMDYYSQGTFQNIMENKRKLKAVVDTEVRDNSGAGCGSTNLWSQHSGGRSRQISVSSRLA